MKKRLEQQKPENLSALRGQPSFVWQVGQDRRLDMILRWGSSTCNAEFSRVLVHGCGVSMRERHGNLSQICSL